MKFDCEKTENCFADAQTYAYELPLEGEALLGLLEGWQLRCNRRLRRPVLIAQREGLTLKMPLGGRQARVSFPQTDWQRQKAEFEQWLEALPWES